MSRQKIGVGGAKGGHSMEIGWCSFIRFRGKNF